MEGIPLQFKSPEELGAFLIDIAIDSTQWSKDKSVDSLYREIKDGETQLFHNREGVIRRTNVLAANIYYEHPTAGILILFEEHPTDRKIDSSLGEKFSIIEDPLNAAKRAVKEELEGIELEDEQIRIFPDKVTTRRDSTSYFGLPTEIEKTKADIFLSSAQFKDDGYKEVVEGRVIRFKWRPCQDENIC